MRRLLVLLTIAVGLGLIAPLALSACGGNDKPPLTPDLIEPPPGEVEAGAPAPPAAK